MCKAVCLSGGEALQQCVRSSSCMLWVTHEVTQNSTHVRGRSVAMQVMAVLHEQGRYLGAIVPQRVLVQPQICLLDYSMGEHSSHLCWFLAVQSHFWM